MEDKIVLADGDFILGHSNGKAHLTAVCPASARRQITEADRPGDWSRNDWRRFLREARRFGRDDLLEDLEHLRDEVLGEKVMNEEPVFDDDAGERPDAVHSLRVHYSHDNYVKVKGTSTREHRDELVELGLRWSPKNREWVAEFDEGLLEAVKEYVAENDTAHDPSKIGYVRCGDCGGFKPEGKACSCNF